MSSSFKKRVIFCDRDGVIVVEPPSDKQLDSLDKFSFIPGAISGLKKLKECGIYEIVLVTNQDGLGTKSFPEDTFWPPHNLMLDTLKGEGVVFDGVYIDRSFPEENAPTRKPRTGMLTSFFTDEYDLSRSWVIGDRETDIELASNLKAQGIYFGENAPNGGAFASLNWNEIADFILNRTRASQINRVTRETSIEIALDLDGKGEAKIQTGIPFFNHMLELFAYHSKIDLIVSASGDLPHHLIEDVGIALGKCLDKAVASKIGMKRYGFFLLPMDEALAQVALDFSGRFSLQWNANFRFEQVEGMPTEMFSHFFESLAQNSRMTLNLGVTGENDHHKIEAVFKGFGRALREAVSIDRNFGDYVPSTKGVL